MEKLEDPRTNTNKKLSMLFIASGPAAPGSQPLDNPFSYLSKYFTGYVIGTTWKNTESASKEYIEKIQPSFKEFRYAPFMTSSYTGVLKQLIHFLNYYKQSKKIVEETHIDIICSYGFFVPGLVSAIISKQYGIPLLIEVPGVPDRAIEFSQIRYKHIARFFQNLIIRFCLSRASALWLLFETQLNSHSVSRNLPVFVSHEFSPLKLYAPTTVSEPIISFLGYPWDLKGVDILIAAFKKILPKHPNATLRIAGYCPDKSYYRVLIEGYEKNIQLLDAMSRDESVRFMQETKIFVLPSRTEAMGRVLLEAAAAKKGIIASRVDGIPYYITHNQTGLLFESENIDELSTHLDTMLSDQQLYDLLSNQAFKTVFDKYTEEQYAENVHHMTKKILSPCKQN